MFLNNLKSRKRSPRIHTKGREQSVVILNLFYNGTECFNLQAVMFDFLHCPLRTLFQPFLLKTVITFAQLNNQTFQLRSMAAAWKSGLLPIQNDKTNENGFFYQNEHVKKPTKPKMINSKRTRPYSLPLSCQWFLIAILLAKLANQHSEVMVITSADATNVPCVVLLDTWVEVRGIKKKKKSPWKHETYVRF